MGNICASTRNKECLYAAKEPMLVKKAFSDCVYYSKVDSKKTLKKRKRRLLRKVASIQDELQNFNNNSVR
tara:strand:- start:511 stop:720 length:210 start_codon:yes stop_codon:yes gene_type:complete